MKKRPCHILSARLWLTKREEDIILHSDSQRAREQRGRWRIQHLVPTFTVYNALFAPNDRHKRETSNVMEKEGTEEVKGSEARDGGVKSSKRRSYKRTKGNEETREKETERERGEGDITRGRSKSTERFQRHVGALWAHTIVRSCTLFSCSWQKNLNWCEWLARARRTCRFFADNRRQARSGKDTRKKGAR